MLEGQGDLVREVQGGRQANQHDVLVLRGKNSSKIIRQLISSRKYHLSTLFQGSKVDIITQADAVPKCDTVEVEKQIEVLREFFLFPESFSLNVDVDVEVF